VSEKNTTATGVQHHKLIQPLPSFAHVQVQFFPDTHRRPQPEASLCTLQSGTSHLGWADGFTELARDAALLSIGVPSKSMLSSEPRAEGPLLKGVVECRWLSKEGAESHGHPWV